eukprot:8718732-Alexandrium_andersonii.AAC.1
MRGWVLELARHLDNASRAIKGLWWAAPNNRLGGSRKELNLSVNVNSSSPRHFSNIRRHSPRSWADTSVGSVAKRSKLDTEYNCSNMLKNSPPESSGKRHPRNGQAAHRARNSPGTWSSS